MRSKTITTRVVKTDLKILFLFFILAILVRAPRLFTMDVWFDEVAILLQTKMSFVEIWNFCKSENFPPFFPWIAKLWSYIDTSDEWFRLLNLLIGSLIPLVAFLLGKEIQDRKFGLIFGSACALSLPLVYYSQVIRMYSLFVLLACISYYTFIKAMETHAWKYWILNSLINVAAFYTFLFSLFIIVSELCIIAWEYRLNLKKYYRIILVNIPALVLLSFWLNVLFQRFKVHQSYIYSHLQMSAIPEEWVYFGTGTSFGKNYIVAVLLNLPFLIGFIVGIYKSVKNKNKKLNYLLVILLLSGSLIVAISIIGQSIFFERYLLFLLPIYLLIVFYGLLQYLSKTRKYLMMAAVLSAMLFSLIYYHLNFITVNDVYRYHGLYSSAADEDGKSNSRIAKFLQDQIQSNEIIVHYSAIVIRSLSFFPSIYFHQRSLPEYIYSSEDLPIYCGGQYQKPGERISSFSQIHPKPSGVWVVTWEDPFLSIHDSPQAIAKRLEKRSWRDYENLPKELYDAGFKPARIVRSGSVSAVHFIRSEIPDYEPLGVEVIRS